MQSQGSPPAYLPLLSKHFIKAAGTSEACGRSLVLLLVREMGLSREFLGGNLHSEATHQNAGAWSAGVLIAASPDQTRAWWALPSSVPGAGTTPSPHLSVPSPPDQPVSATKQAGRSSALGTLASGHLIGQELTSEASGRLSPWHLPPQSAIPVIIMSTTSA